MKIPLWMLQPEAARFHLSEQIELSSCALRALVDFNMKGSNPRLSGGQISSAAMSGHGSIV
ncbi:MAG: hypothetical protein ACREXW_12020 [Gammaproteobacteria bacterium]